VATVPRAKLDTLATLALIEQYNEAISSHAGRYTDTGPRQRRIDSIVEELAARAEDGDCDAIDWLKP
jgi:hypothetical protein